ncbi:hypothetical protein [Sporosalibacterium faouarense]|uniref:hypothetical protein n=1 Tax=Sporosalibacterium faouarense TaxID=516123 RepID=UPI00141D1703|nr:hypothetical protein [Sporosalibacterium faouarense]MTI48603.1 hypothetical protein [Bacillota bacterium]
MELICPLCNGLVEYKLECPKCRSNMTDQGPLVDYLDDYSPYLASDITEKVDGVSHNKCVHLYQCENCSNDKRVTINKVMK